MRDVVDRVLPLAGPAMVALALAMWARYFLIRFGEDDEVPRLRAPVAATVALVVTLVLIAVLEEPVA